MDMFCRHKISSYVKLCVMNPNKIICFVQHIYPKFVSYVTNQINKAHHAKAHIVSTKLSVEKPTEINIAVCGEKEKKMSQTPHQ